MNMCVYMAMTSAWHLVYVYVCNDLQIKNDQIKNKHKKSVEMRVCDVCDCRLV